jgi:hypothetical protein
MPSVFTKRLLFLIGSLLLCISTQVLLFSWGGFFGSHSPSSQTWSRYASLSTPTRPAIQDQRPPFEKGVIFPRWAQTSYGPGDTQWMQALSDIQVQTGARWIEIPILFSQASPTSTQVTMGPSTPTVESVVAGIRAARSRGYHVFVVPLLGVIGPGFWAANIQFASYEQEVQWFDSFWQVYRPYVVAAQVAGADQLSIGTEEVWLEQFVPAVLWNTLIARVRSIFSRIITYSMNWSSLSNPLPTWMSNSNLSMIGVSEYIPLVDTSKRVDPKDMFSLWRLKVKLVLDNLAIRLGKPVIISEIGYRNTADALYQSWETESPTSPPDSIEQAAAYNAALENVMPDPHIAGIFCWGWDGVEAFKLSGQPAAVVLRLWYTS